MSKLIASVALLAVLAVGCFDEEGEGAQEQTVSTVVQGLIAFDQIQSNLTDDPAAAGEALLDFMKMPVAAYQLIAPPFEIGTMMEDMTAARTVPAAPVPDCLIQSGEPACDTYRTGTACEAGNFEFEGVMSRRCADCEDPRGFCSYGWALSKIKFTAPTFALELETKGHWEGMTGQVKPETNVKFLLKGQNINSAGLVMVCACTVLNVVDSMTTSGKPRKLVNSSFMVKGAPNDLAQSHLSALVEFDAEGNPHVSHSTSCPGFSNFEGGCQFSFGSFARPTCGDDYCAYNENDVSCPEDCATNSGKPRCGDGVCDDVREDTTRCPADCGVSPHECGNGLCELGETESSCVGDCGPQL